MTKRTRRRGGRTTPKGTASRSRPRPQPARGEPPLVADARARLEERSPFGLMALASGLIEVTTPRPLDRVPGAETERPDGPSTFLSFATSGLPAMGALSLAIAAMHPDEVLAARLRAAIAPDVIDGGPGWLTSMGEISIVGTSVQTDPLGDGENLFVSWRWPDGSAATLVVYVDHNMGTLVKDAFVVPESLDDLAATYWELDAHLSTTTIDPSDARARATEAIQNTDHTLPPISTDSWPSCRPMAEWLLRRLPPGGAGYVRPAWPESGRQRLLDEFVGAPAGRIRGLTAEQVRQLAEPLVWFGCDYGPGDPLRWSPVSVEIVLADWYPRKVRGLPPADLRRVPDVLAGLVRFAHQRRAVPGELTEETVAAVDRWRGEFLRAAVHQDRDGNDAIADLDVDDLDIDDGLFDGDFEADIERYAALDDDAFMRRAADDLEAAVIGLVGGRTAYERLDDEPLGDVPFDWSRVPAGIRQPAEATLVQLDRWASELFDDEVRTIARAVLAGVLAADPGVFKRSARTDGLAAAILGFLMLRLTGRFSARERRAMPWRVSTQKDLALATGVPASSIGSRARTVAKAVARADIDWPSFLHSTQRREALRTMQIVADWRRSND